MVLLTDEEIKKLENLCKINISNDKHFVEKLEGIIGFLHKTKNIEIPNDFKLKSDNVIHFLHGINHQKEDFLKDNVKHEMLNKSIVIKKVVNK